MNPATEFGSRIDRGLIPAVPVPFCADGQIDASAQERYVAYMAAQPIAGVAVWAHTGRGLMLDGETAERVLRDWREALPEKVIVAGVGSRDPNFERATARTLEMAECAGRIGADALLVYPPTWLQRKCRILHFSVCRSS